MKRIITSIRDLKTQEYMGLGLTKNTAEAQRHFLALLQANNNPIASFPKDYAVHELAIFDTETGKITLADNYPSDVTPHSEVDALMNPVRGKTIDYGDPERERKPPGYIERTQVKLPLDNNR